MKILVISDIHENFDNLVKIFQEIKDKNIQQIICLWDMINNGIAKVITSHNISVHLVWWNNDWEIVNITKTFLGTWNTVSDTVFDSVEFWWRKIFLTHYSSIAKSMAKSWDFDAVFYGHNHIIHEEIIDECYVLNPWEVWAHKTWISSYAVYDTDTNSAEIFQLEDAKNIKSSETSEYIKKHVKFKFSKSKSHQF